MNPAFGNYPKRILFLGIFFLSIPLFSYLFTVSVYKLQWQEFRTVLSVMTTVQIIISVLSLFISFGIFLIRREGYYAFLIFAILLLGFNLYRLFKTLFTSILFVGDQEIHSLDFALVILFSGILFYFLFYFLSKEISVPYRSQENRGFRIGKRDTLPIPFSLVHEISKVETKGLTENISPRGVLVPIPSFWNPGENGTIALDLQDPSLPILKFQATLVRKEEEKGGFRFFYTKDSYQSLETLEQFIDSKFAPRYYLNTEIKIGKKDWEPAVLYNLSRSGAYIQTDKKLQVGDPITLELNTIFGLIQIVILVRWNNPKGQYGKPVGFGSEIIRVENPIRFWFYLFFLFFRSFYSR